MMDHLTAVKTVFRKTFDWNGRAPLSEYWWFALFALSCNAVVIGLVVGTGNGAPVLITLALVLPQLGAAIRRLHDTGRSGYWYLTSMVPFGSLVLLVFLLMPGDKQINEYGQPYSPV